VLDAELLGLIRNAIRSTWSLELLVHVRKEPGRTFTREELVLELRSTRGLIDRGIKDLQDAKLLECAGETCKYAPATSALDALCERLERAYAERPIAVINAIMQSPSDRRQSFADAFKFTKKDE
jgi:hypothetical protein